MPWLLNVVYLLLLAVLSPWLLYQAISKGKYREGWSAKLWGSVPARPQDDRAPCLWFHAVSVGEVNLLEPVLAALSAARPDWRCVISTTTHTGFALARTKYADHVVFYCPLDFSWATRRAMRRMRPDLLVLTELELWPNLIGAARRQGAKVAVINGRLSQRSFRGYRKIIKFYAGLLRQVDWFGVQNDTYAERFRQLGVESGRIEVTGSIKYDGAVTDRHNPTTQRLARLAGFADDDVVFLAGSTQWPEEWLALQTYQALAPNHPRLRLVIVPRHPERFDAVERLLDQSGVVYQRRSQLERSGADPAARVLLVDTVGELRGWWGTAHVAFVGGSMGDRGGQNMIEPAAYGAAVCFGPNTRNFRDIVEALLRSNAAMVVRNGEELTNFVRRCLEQPEEAASMGQRAQQHVLAQLGAARRTARRLAELLTPDEQRTPTPAPHRLTAPTTEGKQPSSPSRFTRSSFL